MQRPDANPLAGEERLAMLARLAELETAVMLALQQCEAGESCLDTLRAALSRSRAWPW